MTNTTPEGLAYIPCLYDDGRAEQCGAMVEDNDDARRTHRAWHANDKSVKDAMRSAISRKDAKVTELERQIDDLRRDLGHIVVPAPVLPVKRSQSGWSDDDEPDTVEPVDFEATTNPVEEPDPEPEAPATYIDPVTGLTMTGTPATHINPSALYTPTGTLT